MKHVAQKGGSLQWQLDYLAIMNMAITWFALQTKPRNEKQVERLLTNKGYECFLPIYRQKRQWSDRVIEIDLPLFPMYIFCRFSPSGVGKAITTPGVTRIVGFGGQYAEVELEEMQVAIDGIDEADLPCEGVEGAEAAAAEAAGAVGDLVVDVTGGEHGRWQLGTLVLSRRRSSRRLRWANCWRILVFTRNPSARERGHGLHKP